jgi:hypoxanthine phosphoribosyltransferase
MKLENYTIFIILFIIFVYHYNIQNKIEKIFFDCYLNYNFVKRPLYMCNSDIYKSFKCLGFPSGHAESSTIVFSLLYFKNLISFNFCLAFIFLISIQRILFHQHTISQVIFGILLGLIYTQIYIINNLSIISLLIIISIGLLFAILSIYKIDEKLKQPIPTWVDFEMKPSIYKKLDTPYYLKIATIYAIAINQGRTYISWSELETFLDIIINKIKNSGIQFDAIVGIKTGGAIISDYVSKKLGIKNYKIKLTREEYNCEKKPIHTINDVFQRQVLNNNGKYSICEEIVDDISGKNIILIDEMVSSGTTMLESIHYLKNKKHVNIIYPTCISLSKKRYKKDIFIDSVIPDLVFVWPWGYDN